MKLLNQGSFDWEKFLDLPNTKTQKSIDKEIQEQISQNDIYTIFDKSNSREEIIRRLKEQKNERLILSNTIANIMAIVIGCLVLIISIFHN